MHFPSAQPREAVMGHQVFKELGDFAVPTLGIRAGPSTGDGTTGHLDTFCGEELSQEQVFYIKLMLQAPKAVRCSQVPSWLSFKGLSILRAKSSLDV